MARTGFMTEVRRPVLLPHPSLGTLFKGREKVLQQTWCAPVMVWRKRLPAGGAGVRNLAVEYAGSMWTIIRPCCS
jgi:hypothetical protein